MGRGEGAIVQPGANLGASPWLFKRSPGDVGVRGREARQPDRHHVQVEGTRLAPTACVWLMQIDPNGQPLVQLVWAPRARGGEGAAVQANQQNTLGSPRAWR